MKPQQIPALSVWSRSVEVLFSSDNPGLWFDGWAIHVPAIQPQAPPGKSSAVYNCASLFQIICCLCNVLFIHSSDYFASKLNRTWILKEQGGRVDIMFVTVWKWEKYNASNLILDKNVSKCTSQNVNCSFKYLQEHFKRKA